MKQANKVSNEDGQAAGSPPKMPKIGVSTKKSGNVVRSLTRTPPIKSAQITPTSNMKTPIRLRQVQWHNLGRHSTTTRSLQLGTAPTQNQRKPVPLDEVAQLKEKLNEQTKQLECYHGTLPHEDVRLLLKKEGDFLLRRTHQDGELLLVLTVQHNEKQVSIQIDVNKKGVHCFDGLYFPTVVDMLNHHITHESPVGDGAQVRALLKRPIKRQKWQLSNDQIVIGEKLGQGAYGEVYKAVLSFGVNQVKEVAVKTMRTTLINKADMKRFLSEARTMRKYRHTNIVELIGVAADDEPIMIVMELAPGGSLLNILKKHSLRITVGHRCRFCYEAASGMLYLEKQNCVHRDVAARNCLMGAHGEVKIADFGLCKPASNTADDAINNTRLPIRWLAPETLNLGLFTLQTDVWSFGVLIWEIFSDGATPFGNLTNEMVKKRICSESPPLKPPVGMPVELIQLLKKCFNRKPQARPNFTKIHKIISKSVQFKEATQFDLSQY